MQNRVRIIASAFAVLYRVTKLMALIGLVGLTALAVIVICEVLARWLLRYAVPGVSDVSALFTALAISACFGVVGANRSHIQVGILWGSHPRVCRFLDGLGNLLGFALFALFSWQMWQYGAILGRSNEVTYLVQWHKEPWMKACAVLLAFCLPVHLILFLKDIADAFRPGIAENPAGRP